MSLIEGALGVYTAAFCIELISLGKLFDGTPGKIALFGVFRVVVAAVMEVMLLFAAGLLATIEESSTDWACWFEGGRVDPFGSNQTNTFKIS